MVFVFALILLILIVSMYVVEVVNGEIGSLSDDLIIVNDIVSLLLSSGDT